MAWSSVNIVALLKRVIRKWVDAIRPINKAIKKKTSGKNNFGSFSESHVTKERVVGRMERVSRIRAQSNSRKSSTCWLASPSLTSIPHGRRLISWEHASNYYDKKVQSWVLNPDIYPHEWLKLIYIAWHHSIYLFFVAAECHQWVTAVQKRKNRIGFVLISAAHIGNTPPSAVGCSASMIARSPWIGKDVFSARLAEINRGRV